MLMMMLLCSNWIKSNILTFSISFSLSVDIKFQSKWLQSHFTLKYNNRLHFPNILPLLCKYSNDDNKKIKFCYGNIFNRMKNDVNFPTKIYFWKSWKFKNLLEIDLGQLNFFFSRVENLQFIINQLTTIWNDRNEKCCWGQKRFYYVLLPSMLKWREVKFFDRQIFIDFLS